MPRLVTCPHCKKSAEYDETNPHRPFCSQRCRQIDLGQWASDAYAIPGKSIEIEDSNPSSGGGEDEDLTPSPILH